MNSQGDTGRKHYEPVALTQVSANPMSFSIAMDSIPLRVDAAGAVRVGETRVLLDTVVTAFKLGESAEEIADDFPTLDLADVYAVIAYYLRHGSEVDALRAQIEQHHPPQKLRNRLLARHDAANTSKTHSTGGGRERRR
jgi:uncharacterized protein (DUF433 family)